MKQKQEKFVNNINKNEGKQKSINQVDLRSVDYFRLGKKVKLKFSKCCGVLINCYFRMNEI